MNKNSKDFAEKFFNHAPDALDEPERRIVEHFGDRKYISHDTNKEFDTKQTFGQKVADQVATFGGSWTFIIIFISALVLWVLLNSFILARRNDAFDPYPYILLNLFLSMLAAIQAPIILMSQNRQAVKDRFDAAHDYEVNLKAELEILSLHQKLDDLREMKWDELIEMQQEQIKILTFILQKRETKIAE